MSRIWTGPTPCWKVGAVQGVEPLNIVIVFIAVMPAAAARPARNCMGTANNGPSSAVKAINLVPAERCIDDGRRSGKFVAVFVWKAVARQPGKALKMTDDRGRGFIQFRTLITNPGIRMSFSRVRVIDSHTGGEPTRTIIAGGPDLGNRPLAERLITFARDHNAFRNAVINEPRGSDVLVGALLQQPEDPSCITGVIYFNNVGTLQMCGHGTIGVVASLAHLGCIGPGQHKIETPVGIVPAELNEDGSVTIENVPSYRSAANVTVDVPGFGPVTGDVAWGGNWFFLVGDHGYSLTPDQIPRLAEYAKAIRKTLAANGITGANGSEIDHIELFADSATAGVDSRNFVLCPGGAYDRSPCGTGTSAKLACLFADGKLAPGKEWYQESIIGSVFKGCFRLDNGSIIPRITGTAFVNAEADLVFNPADPFCMGLPA